MDVAGESFPGEDEACAKVIEHGGMCPLPFAERDRVLLKSKWPSRQGLGPEWKTDPTGRYLARSLMLLNPTRSGTPAPPTELKEAIVRFPNAPIYSLHQAPEHPVRLDEEWPNYHTLRVLARQDLPHRRARHVFLLHNGLNETDDMVLHYRIASWILAARKDAVCIIRPLPGHLSRYPFQGPFSERPLDEYLRDPAAVFRQFLRYMVETQWLLSVLTPRKSHEVMTGCELLLYNSRPDRLDCEALAGEIVTQGNSALEASAGGTHHSREKLDPKVVEQSIETLRDLIGWVRIRSNGRPDREKIDRPAIHTVGYSMGGFVAQSVFCTWPYAVASCSSLFAGGAIRDLAPTAFAHPEEWQSVLHGLRAELDQARVDGYFKPGRSTIGGREEDVVAGVKQQTFDYLNRTFVDVFLQMDRGSYSTRLAEFGRRMLFILGGDDPIVRTRNVLDAAPPGGINLHQIGDVSHFPSRKGNPVEEEQREFWLPELGGMIGRFAERSAGLLQRTHNKNWQTGEPVEVEERVIAERPLDLGLPNTAFEQELDAMLELVDEQKAGWLFIARNQIPTVFQGEEAFRYHAAAMHHAEDLIGDYVESLASRAASLTRLEPRFTLLVPGTQVPGEDEDEEGFAAKQQRSERARFSKSEVGVRHPPRGGGIPGPWASFTEAWCARGAVRKVRGHEYTVAQLGEIGAAWAELPEGRGDGPAAETTIPLTMLPDVWIAVDDDAREDLLNVGPKTSRDEIEASMVDLACKLVRGTDRMAEKLARHLTRGGIRIVKVSAAELNPRYRGRLLDGSPRDARGAAGLLIHWAMAYSVATVIEPAASQPVAVG